VWLATAISSACFVLLRSTIEDWSLVDVLFCLLPAVAGIAQSNNCVFGRMISLIRRSRKRRS
jgi:hypothetical protein